MGLTRLGLQAVTAADGSSSARRGTVSSSRSAEARCSGDRGVSGIDSSAHQVWRSDREWQSHAETLRLWTRTLGPTGRDRPITRAQGTPRASQLAPQPPLVRAPCDVNPQVQKKNAYMHTCVHTCVRTCIHVSMYTRERVRMHVYGHVCM